MGHHHHHYQEGSCNVSDCACACHKQKSSCCHQDECHEHGSFAKELLELADEAWMEVLKEKIKENIKSGIGKNLDELAKLVSEANHSRWKHKMCKEKSCDSFECKIDEFFKRES